MRILLINDCAGDFGGAERYVAEVSRALRDKGFEIHWAFGTKKGDTDPTFPAHPLPKELLEFPWFRRPSVEPVHRLLDSVRPDLIYMQNVLNPWTVRALRENCESFRFVHDHRLFCAEGKILWRSLQPCKRPFGIGCLWKTCMERCMGRNPAWWMANLTVKPAEIRAAQSLNGLVVASEYMKGALSDQGFDAKAIHVNPLFSRFPVAVGRFEREAFLLYVGQLSRRKGVPCLLEHFSRMPGDLRLELVGEAPTPEERRCVDAALAGCEAKDRVFFSGWLRGRELLEKYQRAAMLVMPSLWPEPFGLAGVEALSQGTPVVAFASGAIPEWLVESGAGLSVAPGQGQGLVEAVERIWRSTEDRRAMGDRGRRYVGSRLTLERHVDQLIEMFDQRAEF